MENSKLYNLTIEQLKQIFNFSEFWGNDLILIPPEKKPEGISFFKYPCRLDAFAIIIGISGESKATINLHDIKVTPGTFVANIPSNIFQTNEMSDDFSCIAMIASRNFIDDSNIDRRNMTSVFLHIQENSAMILDNDEFVFLKKLFDLLRETLNEHDSIFKTDIIHGFASIIIPKICDCINNHTPDTNKANSKKQNRHQACFNDFMELLSQHHRQQRSVGFYANEMNITPKYFSSIIKNVSGKSAAEWIDNYVILEAKNMLKFSDKTIQEVAYALNFSTQSFFGKYFKHHTGISPKQYREND